MKKRMSVRRITLPEYSNDIVVFPRKIYPLLDPENMPERVTWFIIMQSVSEEWNKDNEQLNRYKEFTDIILKHMTNNGWSNDYTINFWNMDEKELKVVSKMFEKKKEETSEED